MCNPSPKDPRQRAEDAEGAFPRLGQALQLPTKQQPVRDV